LLRSNIRRDAPSRASALIASDEAKRLARAAETAKESRKNDAHGRA